MVCIKRSSVQSRETNPLAQLDSPVSDIASTSMPIVVRQDDVKHRKKGKGNKQPESSNGGHYLCFGLFSPSLRPSTVYIVHTGHQGGHDAQISAQSMKI